MASLYSACLDNDTDYEDRSCKYDGILARVLFCEEAGEERANPRTQFENGRQPSFPALVRRIVGVVIAHIYDF